MLKRLLLNFVVKPVAVVLGATAVGVAFAILPCYVFPLFGADYHNWCGFKSTPPHFVLQFWIGFIFAVAVGGYLSYRPRRAAKPARGQQGRDN